jgi:NADH dehydrogenase
MDSERNIVIVGGGFAGTTLAQDLEKRLRSPWHLVLVSDESYTTFNPMLAEVVGASVFPEQVIVPVRQMLRQTQFIMAKVADIDTERRVAHAATLAGMRELPYEHLVLALGVQANLDLVPGMREHALPLKLVGDALFIRNRVLQRLARMELEHDPEVRRHLGHFVVVGGGFSGVEVAGELADYLRSACRFYPRLREDEASVTILQDTQRLLPELPEELGAAAAASMRARGIHVRLGERAARVGADGVTLASEETIPAATVICTIGTRANPLADSLARRIGQPLQRGRLPTLDDMSVPGVPGIWALGDCALVKNAEDDQASPPTAQFAVAQAHQLAANILRHMQGQPTTPFAYRMKGMMATIGHMKGVARVYGINFKGLPAWMLWRALYLTRMPTFGRKLRIFVEWAWSMFFPVDITHLRFTRTTDEEAQGVAELPQPSAQRTTFERPA